MLEEYYTVNPAGKDEMIIQKSRFIGYVKRAETEKEAQANYEEDTAVQSIRSPKLPQVGVSRLDK